MRFVEAVCTHQKAEWAGQPFLLSPNQLSDTGVSRLPPVSGRDDGQDSRAGVRR